MKRSRPEIDLLAARLKELRVELQGVNPEGVAEKTGAEYLHDEDEIHLLLWDLPLRIFLNGYVVRNMDGEELPSFKQTLVLYYLSKADGTSLSGKWVSFAELPEGRMYDRAFQGYTGDELVKKFGLDVDAYKIACETARGKFVEIGGVAYTFWAFPRVPIVVNYWAGDNDFPSSCKLLFDDSVSHYLPTDACAILGSNLTRRLVKSYE